MIETTTPSARISAENPFAGLAAFSEDARSFFFGRDREIEELSRLIRRGSFAALFGRSGLGKTSLLQAGVFPLLRTERLLPVVVRFYFADAGADLVEQVLDAIAREAAAHSIEVPAAKPGETLWEYLHRSRMWDARNHPITPVLVFDQFEEIFTLGRADPRVSRLLTELEDLIENRIPQSVRQRLESSEEDLPFSYERQHYKVLISLREDYLPQLDELADHIPSIRIHRMRLTRMTGAQALEAILGPGADIVDEASARRIVRFVTASGEQGQIDRDDGDADAVPGDAQLDALDVEPALLSLVCFELNEERRKQGREKIDADMLRGAATQILSSFYERAVAGHGPEVRAFIEDRLLTASGFRGTVAMEDALCVPGLTREAVDELVNQRLLRVEMHLGIPHLELTHDVLTGIVDQHRRLRRAREKERLGRRRAARRYALAIGVVGLIAIVAGSISAVTFSMYSKVKREKQITLAALAETEEAKRQAEAATLKEKAATLEAEQRLAELKRAQRQRGAATLRRAAQEAGGAGKVARQLALLAGALRAEPGDVDTASRIMNLLRQRNWVWQPAPIVEAAFSSDGDDLTTVGVRGTVWTWDTENGWPTGRPLDTGLSVELAAISPDGGLLAIVSPGGIVSIQHLPAGERIEAPLQLTSRANSLRFDSQSRRIVVAVGNWTDERGYAQVFDAATGAACGAPMMHGARVAHAEFDPAGAHVITASWDCTARIWNAETGAPESAPLHHDDWVDFAKFSPDSALAVTTSWDHTARVWNVEDGTLADTLEHQNRVVGADFSIVSSDRRDDDPLLRLATACTADRQSYVQVWEQAAAGSTSFGGLQRELRNHAAITGVRFGPGGGTAIAIGLLGPQYWTENRSTRQSSVAASNESAQGQTAPSGAFAWTRVAREQQRPVLAFSLTGDESSWRTVTGDEEGTARLWAFPRNAPHLLCKTQYELQEEDWDGIADAAAFHLVLAGIAESTAGLRVTPDEDVEPIAAFELPEWRPNQRDLALSAEERAPTREEAAFVNDYLNQWCIHSLGVAESAIVDRRDEAALDPAQLALYCSEAWRRLLPNAYWPVYFNTRALHELGVAQRLLRRPGMMETLRRAVAARVECVEWKRRAGESPAHDLGNLAFTALFAEQPKLAISAAKEGLELDPSLNWIATNLGHGYLFSGDTDAARQVYLQHANETTTGYNEERPFAWYVLDDLQLLRRAGLEAPGMDEIEALMREYVEE